MRKKSDSALHPVRIGFVFNHGIIVGGGEISFLDLICGLDRTQWHPVVWVPEAAEIKRKLEERAIENYIMSFPAIRDISFVGFIKEILRIRREFLNQKIALVHINGARAMLYAGFAAKLAGIPVVWHVRVLERDGWLDRIRGCFASIVIANSKAVANSLKPYIGNRPCNVVYNGIRLADWQQAKPIDLHNKFGVSSVALVILYVGRLSRWKAVHVLVDACAKLYGKTNPFLLLIVGQPDKDDPDYMEILKNKVAQQGLKEITVFAGWQDDIPSIMKASSVLVLPSENEPFGRVIIEAWAAELPVIATRGGGAAELITDNHDGLLFEIGNVEQLVEKLKLFFTSRDILSLLRENGRKRALEFSLEKHIENVSLIYQKVLKQNV